MNYDHNKKIGLFKFQTGYRKFYLNNPKGYSKKYFTVHVGFIQFHLLFNVSEQDQGLHLIPASEAGGQQTEPFPPVVHRHLTGQHSGRS